MRFAKVTSWIAALAIAMSPNLLLSQMVSSTVKGGGDFWTTDWSNNGLGDINGWILRPSDSYLSGYPSSQLPAQLVPISLNGNGWAACLYYNQNFGTWTWSFSNGGGGLIQGWPISPNDRYVMARVGPNSNSDLYAMNRSRSYAAIFGMVNSNWQALWVNDQNWLGYWWLGTTEQYVVGNFHGQSPQREILSANWGSRAAALQTYDGLSQGTWYPRWDNQASGWLGGGVWAITSSDRYVAADFDGDGTDELLCISTAYSPAWAMLIKFNGSTWLPLWFNGAGGYIGSWYIGTTENYAAGDLDGNPGAEFFAANYGTGWAQVLSFNGSGWTTRWHNGGLGNVNNWQIGADRYLIDGFYNGSSRLLAIRPQNGWAAMLKYNCATCLGTKLLKAQATQTPASFDLSQNYPNPFNPSTRIDYSLPSACHATLKVYDLLGREVQSLVNSEMEPGYYHVDVDAQNLSTGMYFYRLTAGTFSVTRKFQVLK